MTKKELLVALQEAPDAAVLKLCDLERRCILAIDGIGLLSQDSSDPIIAIGIRQNYSCEEILQELSNDLSKAAIKLDDLIATYPTHRSADSLSELAAELKLLGAVIQSDFIE